MKLIRHQIKECWVRRDLGLLCENCHQMSCAVAVSHRVNYNNENCHQVNCNSENCHEMNYTIAASHHVNYTIAVNYSSENCRQMNYNHQELPSCESWLVRIILQMNCTDESSSELQHRKLIKWNISTRTVIKWTIETRTVIKWTIATITVIKWTIAARVNCSNESYQVNHGWSRLSFPQVLPLLTWN